MTRQAVQVATASRMALQSPAPVTHADEKWWEAYEGIEYTSDGRGDYYDKMMLRFMRVDKHLRATSGLSSKWSKGRRKATTPQGVVQDLHEIRNSLRNLLSIHGLPKQCTFDIATIGNGKSGAARFDDVGTWKRPRIYLDKTAYEMCDGYEMLDVYAGVALHEAEHVLETRLLFEDMEAGKCRGADAMWRGLIEDERIEHTGRKRSIGFAPYIQATKRVLFEKQELGNALSKWDTLPDMDKVIAISFAFIRCPYLLTDEHKTWATLGGTVVFERLRELFDKVPVTETFVKVLAKRLADFMKEMRDEYKQMENMSDEEIAEQLANQFGHDSTGGQQSGNQSGDGADSDDSAGSAGEGSEGSGESGGSGAEGKPQEDDSDDAGSGSSDGSNGQGNEGSDASGDSDSGEAGEGSGQATEANSEAEQEGQGQSGASGQSSEDDGSEADGGSMQAGTSGGSQGVTADEVAERRKRQTEADEADDMLKQAQEKFEQLAKDAIDRLAAGSASTEQLNQESIDGGNSTETNEKEVNSAKKRAKIAKAEKQRGNDRFSAIEVQAIVARMDEVSDPLTAEESKEHANAERNRLQFGILWQGTSAYGKATSSDRRTIIIHPKPEDGEELYKQAHDEVRPLVSKMRNAFSFRMGKRTYMLPERTEGKIHRRRLPFAKVTDRVFYTKHTKVAKGLSVCILLDESGSMGSLYGGYYGYSGNVLDNKAGQCLKTGVLLAEALRGMQGIELEVYSFTTCGDYDNDCLIKYLYGKNNSNPKSLGNYGNGSANYDHIAIEQATELFVNNTVNENRLMIVCCDGMPCGNGYGGLSTYEAVKQKVNAARKLGITVMQVAITGGMKSDSEQMYGKGAVLEFTDMDTLVRDFGKVVKRAVKKTTIQ